MHNKKVNEWMNKKMDGALSAEEEKLLHGYLQNNSAAQQEMYDLEKSMDLLAVLQDVEPPAHIKQNVMASIDHQRYMQKAFVKKERWFYALLPSYKTGLAFACGLLLGILMITFFIQNDLPPTDSLYGTMGLKTEETMSVSSQIDLDNPLAKGSITILESGKNIFINNQLQSLDNGLSFQIRYEPQQIIFTGYRSEEQSSILLENNDGLLTVQAGGENNTQLLFSKKSAEALRFNIKIISDQQTLLDRNVEINPKNNKE